MHTITSGNNFSTLYRSESVNEFIEHFPIAMLSITPLGDVLTINQACLTLFGCKNAGEFITHNYITNPSREIAQSIVLPELLRQNSSFSQKCLWAKTGAGSIFIKEHFRPIFLNGIIQYYEVVVEDFSESYKLKRLLDITEEKFNAIINQVPIGIYRIIAGGEIIFANQYLTNLVGYDSFSQFSGLTVYQFWVTPEENKDFFHSLVSQGLSNYKRDLLLRKKDGEIIWVQDTGKIFYDTSNEVLFYDGIIEEISERKNSELELKQLMAAINQISEGIVITSSKGEIIYTNPAFENMTQYTADEVRGKRMNILKSKQHSKEFYKKLWNTINSGNTWSGIICNARKNGELYEEHMVISPVKDKNGEIVNFVSVKRDITEERKLEQQVHQSQKLQAIGTLAGGIAHDFNNILMGMQIYTEILLKKAIPESPEKDILLKIYSAQNRGKDLIKQILSFSRQSGDEREPLQIHIIIKEALKLISTTFPSSLILDQKINDVGYILGNPAQMHQIVHNLCTNALYAMDGKGVLKIELSLVESIDLAHFKKAGNNSWICLKVADTGCGIEKKIHDRIFDPFFTTKTVGEGTGLGLATVHGIIKQYGGEIKFTTEIGIGTIFYIYLPAL